MAKEIYSCTIAVNDTQSSVVRLLPQTNSKILPEKPVAMLFSMDSGEHTEVMCNVYGLPNNVARKIADEDLASQRNKFFLLCTNEAQPIVLTLKDKIVVQLNPDFDFRGFGAFFIQLSTPITQEITMEVVYAYKYLSE